MGRKTGLTGLEEVSCTGLVADDRDNENDADHIRSVLDAVAGSVIQADKDRLRLLLTQYSTVFSKGELDLGQATQMKHKINTMSKKPVLQPLRRQPYHVQEEVDDQLDQMQQQGIISQGGRQTWLLKRRLKSGYISWIPTSLITISIAVPCRVTETQDI